MGKFKLSVDVKLMLTFSKIVALLILILVFLYKDAPLMMFAIPFVVGLIMGKQFFDSYFNSPRGSMPNVEDVKSKLKEDVESETPN